MNNSSSWARRFVPALFVAVGLLAGCAGTVKNMQESTVQKTAEIKPEPGKALVVFVRSSGFGFAIQSSVFEVKEPDSKLVGIVAAKAKVAYQTDPGKHLFMVVGESADYLDAELQPDRTYYALVTPRMGLWKARFSLEAVNADTAATPQFKADLNDCAWVEMNAESAAWARENMASVRSKHTEYYPQWQAKPAVERPRLSPADGR